MHDRIQEIEIEGKLVKLNQEVKYKGNSYYVSFIHEDYLIIGSKERNKRFKVNHSEYELTG